MKTLAGWEQKGMMQEKLKIVVVVAILYLSSCYLTQTFMGKNWYHTNGYNKRRGTKGHHHLAAARSASTEARYKRERGRKGTQW